MLITFLLITRVSGEWVEISQQHYRKPVRPTHHYALTTEVISESYANHSVSEYQWNKGANMNNSPGKLKTFPDSMNMANRRHQPKHFELDADVVKNVNVGKVNRVQLTTTPVKLSAVNLKSGSEDTITSSGKEVSTNLSNNEFDNENRKVSYRNFEKDQQLDRDGTTDIPFNYRKGLYQNNSNNALRNYADSKHINNPKPLITGDESLEEVVNSNPFYKISEIKSQGIEEIYTKTNGRQPISDISIQKLKDAANDSLLNMSANIVEKDKLNTNQKMNSDRQNYNKNPEYTARTNLEKGDEIRSTTEKPLPSDEKSNGVDVIVKLIKLVSDTISSNTRRSFGSKMRYLEDLKNTILANIEDRIDATWPEDHDRRRRSRAPEEGVRGHLEFPSSESTLMTISFLTFAVFLIKLVLQVIQTYKNKAMMLAPLVVATAGRASVNHLQSEKYN